jgi:hypothetical protein
MIAARRGPPGAAVEAVLSSGPAAANRIALVWRSSLVESGLASETIAHRLFALRSIVEAARRIDRTDGGLDVEGLGAEPRRDMWGPDLIDVHLVWRGASLGATDPASGGPGPSRRCTSTRDRGVPNRAGSTRGCRFAAHEGIREPGP